MRPLPRHTTRRPRLATAFALIAAAAGFLAGCVNQSKEVGTYREVLDGSRPKPAPPKVDERLTLERAFALANADNEQLASQGETYLQALIAKNRAVAAFLPTVSFQPNFTLEQAPKGQAQAVGPGAPSVSAADEAASQGGYVHQGGVLRRFEAPVVGSMNFTYGSVETFKGLELTVVAERQRLLDAQQTVLLNVAQTYFQVLISTRQAAVLEHSLSLQEARVRDIEARYRAHLALALELSQARALESGTRVSLAQAYNDTRNGRRTLAVLIGAPSVDGPLVDEVSPPDDPEPVASCVQTALAGRQDLLAAQAAIKAARYGVDAAVAEYYPSVSLNAAGFLYRENFANATKWDGILVANLPIFSGGAIHADVRAAWSRFRQAALAESYLHREIEEGVRTAYDNFATSGEELGELRSEVKAAADAYRQATQLEKNGLAIPLDVLSSQDTLLSVRLQYANEAYARTIFYLDLVRSEGRLDPEAPERLRQAPAGPPIDSP